jgi:hypothetical protein
MFEKERKICKLTDGKLFKTLLKMTELFQVGFLILVPKSHYQDSMILPGICTIFVNYKQLLQLKCLQCLLT